MSASSSMLANVGRHITSDRHGTQRNLNCKLWEKFTTAGMVESLLFFWGGTVETLFGGKSEQTCWAVLSELIGDPAHAVNLDIASHISICRCVRMADERWRASRFLTIVICATHIHNCCFQKLLFDFYVILTISIWSVSYAPWYLRSLPC